MDRRFKRISASILKIAASMIEIYLEAPRNPIDHLALHSARKARTGIRPQLYAI